MSAAPREKARVLLQFRRPADAETAVREALAADPNDAYLHYLLSHSLRAQGRTAAAVEAAGTAVGLAPEWAEAHSAHGYALLARKKKTAAAGAFREAIRLEPENPDYYCGLAEVLLAAGRPEPARGAAEDGLALDPQHIGCMNCWAVSMAALGATDEAVEQLEVARSIDPLDPYPHAVLGWVWRLRGRPVRAVRHYLDALRLDPVNWDHDVALRDAVMAFSGRVCLWLLVLIPLTFAAVAILVTIWAPSDTSDRVLCAAGAMLLPFGGLLLRERFRSSVVLLPFRLGRSLCTPADRRYLAAILAGFAVAALFTLAVGLTSAPGRVLLTCLAVSSFPVVPLVVWLDWRVVSPFRAAAASVVLSVVQSGLLVALFARSAHLDEGLLLLAAIGFSVITCALVPLGDIADKSHRSGRSLGG